MLILISGDATSLSYGRGVNSQVIDDRRFLRTVKTRRHRRILRAIVHREIISNFAAQLRRHIHKIECFADLREKCSDVQRYSAYARLRYVRFDYYT